ncbi:MAG TPA: NfeD family protein [Longimicrobium sp.]|jgi:membrane-bound serine protease (ClpP class)|uniref:NfeD family protein n=1 Tax=Longimicrobium sp. TaxID=2029185 RepID=UPI002EDA8D2B
MITSVEPQSHAFHAVLGMAGWAPVLVLIAGLVLLCVELFVLPGFGVAGILGVLALMAGVFLTVTGPVPGVAEVSIAAFSVISALTLLGVGTWAVLATRQGRYHALFGGSLDRERGYVSAPPRPELEGVEGVALTDLRPAGAARIGGERLDVVSETGWIGAGTPVRVIRSDGYRTVVRPLALPDGQG